MFILPMQFDERDVYQLQQTFSFTHSWGRIVAAGGDRLMAIDEVSSQYQIRFYVYNSSNDQYEIEDTYDVGSSSTYPLNVSESGRSYISDNIALHTVSANSTTIETIHVFVRDGGVWNHDQSIDIDYCQGIDVYNDESLIINTVNGYENWERSGSPLTFSFIEDVYTGAVAADYSNGFSIYGNDLVIETGTGGDFSFYTRSSPGSSWSIVNSMTNSGFVNPTIYDGLCVFYTIAGTDRIVIYSKSGSPFTWSANGDVIYDVGPGTGTNGPSVRFYDVNTFQFGFSGTPYKVYLYEYEGGNWVKKIERSHDAVVNINPLGAVKPTGYNVNYYPLIITELEVYGINA